MIRIFSKHTSFNRLSDPTSIRSSLYLLFQVVLGLFIIITDEVPQQCGADRAFDAAAGNHRAIEDIFDRLADFGFPWIFGAREGVRR